MAEAGVEPGAPPHTPPNPPATDATPATTLPETAELGAVLKQLLKTLHCSQAAAALDSEVMGAGVDEITWPEVQRLLGQLGVVTGTDRTDEGQTTEGGVRTPAKATRKRIAYDTALVQINAPKAEINRRIAAFIQRKRNDNDESNILEFCEPRTDTSQGWSARTNPAPILRLSERSHLKVSRVENLVGPAAPGPIIPKAAAVRQGESTGKETAQSLPAGVEERLGNMEAHVGLSRVPLNVYERMKRLEDRILELESCSPELFQVAVRHTGPRLPPSSLDPGYVPAAGEGNDLFKGPMPQAGRDDVASIEDIDQRIAQLKAKLSRKRRRSESGTESESRPAPAQR